MFILVSDSEVYAVILQLSKVFDKMDGQTFLTIDLSAKVDKFWAPIGLLFGPNNADIMEQLELPFFGDIGVVGHYAVEELLRS